MRLSLGAFLALLTLALAPAAGAAESQPSVLAYYDSGNGVAIVEAGHKEGETPGRLIAPGASSTPSFAPDGRRIALLNFDDSPVAGKLRIIDREGRKLREDIQLTDFVRGTSWSPDGIEVAYGCYQGGSIYGVCAVNVETGATRTVVALNEDDYLDPSMPTLSWASDNSAIAFSISAKKQCEDPEATYRCAQDQVATTHPINGGYRKLTNAEDGAWGASFSPDATRLAYYERSVGIMVGGPNGGGSTLVPYAQMADSYEVPETTWSPDGTRVLFTTSFGPAISQNSDGFSVDAVHGGPWTHEIATNNSTYTPTWAPAIPACTVPGTPEPDPLDGTDGGDVICGEGGDDVIDGKGGADSITGGPGNDTITGGAGTDTIAADAGDDTVAAVDGEIDTVACAGGADTVTADPADRVEADCESVTRSEPEPEPEPKPEPGGGGVGGGGGGGGGGGPVVPPATIQPDVTRPAFSAFSLAAKKVKAGKPLSLRYSLSESAAVVVTLARAAKGRKAGKRCRAQTKANRSKPKCTRFIRARRRTELGTAGANTLKMPTKGLKRGRYRVELAAKDAAGNEAPAQRASLKLR